MLNLKEKILLFLRRLIWPPMLEGWAHASSSVASSLRNWPLGRIVWSFLCLEVGDGTSSGAQETDFNGGE